MAQKLPKDIAPVGELVGTPPALRGANGGKSGGTINGKPASRKEIDAFDKKLFGNSTHRKSTKRDGGLLMANGAKRVSGAKDPGDETEYIKHLTKAEKSMNQSSAGAKSDRGEKIEERADEKFSKISDAFHGIPKNRKRVIRDSVIKYVNGY